jgi:rhodanese-related sulfurtransferase
MPRSSKLVPVAVLALVLGVSLQASDQSQPAAPPKSQVRQGSASPRQDQTAQARNSIKNPNINMERYLEASKEAAKHRAERRVTEEEFLKMSQEPGTIVLDARSKEKFDLLHVKGAINLSFPDIDQDSLPRTLPDKNARILIYCNNNFTGPRAAFAPKSASLSLNLSTYIALYESGYRNVYELGPLLDPSKTILTLEPTPSTNVEK